MRAVAAVAAAMLAVLGGMHAPAARATTTFSAGSVTLKAGTKILCVLARAVDSASLKVGTDFQLRVDDPAHPELAGAAIHGHVTAVSQPAGLNRARIGFTLDYIRFKDGQRQPIRAEVLNRAVVNTNSAYAAAERKKLLLPPAPVGTVTPGPVVFQMTIGGGGRGVSVTPPPVGSSGGYVYAAHPHETIVVAAGTPVTISLTSSLKVL